MWVYLCIPKNCICTSELHNIPATVKLEGSAFYTTYQPPLRESLRHKRVNSGSQTDRVFRFLGSKYTIYRRFDLKGSSHGRTTSKPESEIDANTTLKDLDLSYIFRLHKSWFQEFCRQVDRDCDLLEQERIMDYSLLVGLHFRERRDTTSNEGNIKNSKETASPRLDMDQLLSDQTRLFTLKLGMNMPARVEKTVRIRENELIGEPTGNIYEVVLFFGIIDILQDYDISKKLEHAYKAFQYDATSISAVDPKLYSRRFKEFIFKAFIEDT